MKKNRLLVLLLSALLASWSFAEKKSMANEKAIYKWEDNGLVYYSHIKPSHVKDFIKLDSRGMRIEEYTEDFGEVVEIVMRPENLDKAETAKETNETSPEDDAIATLKEEEIRKKNCETAKRNMKTLDSGEVYEQDEKGNMIRLSLEQIDAKRKNVTRDVDYFCGE